MGAGDGHQQVVHAAWCSSIFGEPDVVRIFDPPRRVIVETRSWDANAGRPPGFASRPPSLKVRAGGVRLERTMIGHQVAWVRLYDGQWRAVVTISLVSANQRTTLTTDLWVDESAIRPA